MPAQTGSPPKPGANRATDPSGSLAPLPFVARSRRRFQIGVGAASVLVAMAILVAVLSGAASGTSVEVAPVAPESRASDPATGGQGNPPLLVHVLGAVRVPGLYELPPGARVVDAVAAAGGLLDDADPAAVNLARPVTDGEQIAVPRVGEAPPTATGSSGGVISLNTATVEQLDTLPRLGPAMAQRIIEWREQGNRFTSVDDLLEISGFGAKTVDALRGLAGP